MNDCISTAHIYDSNYLAHHGIKGQKWGIRRFQNSDGSLTVAGKKRYSKEVQKQISGIWDKNEELQKSVKNKLLDRDVKAIKDSFKNFRAASIEFDKHDYFNSKEKENASSRAYDDVLKWYKKNDPDRLKIMQSQTDDLMLFHDFRKSVEGLEDQYWSQGEKKWYQDPSHKKAKEQYENSWDQYRKIIDDSVYNLIGNAKNKKINGKNGLEKFYTRELGDIVGDAVMASVIPVVH